MIYFDPLVGESKSWEDLDREWEALSKREQEIRLAQTEKECIQYKRREEPLYTFTQEELNDVPDTL